MIDNNSNLYTYFENVLLQGDSNIHLNIAGDELTPEILQLIDPFVYEFTSKLKGSISTISAEHGIGLLKPKYLKYSKTTEAIRLMKRLKTIMDPNGILNPYQGRKFSLLFI